MLALWMAVDGDTPLKKGCGQWCGKQDIVGRVV